MPDIDITAADAHAYDVQISDGGGEPRRLRVSVTPGFLRRLGLTAAQEPALVRASVTYLLEHGPADGLPEAVSLDDVERDHPDYPEQIQVWV